MSKIDLAGLQIDAITKKDFLNGLLGRISAGQKTFVITPYSEFLYHGLENPKLLEIFNKADFAVADGIGIFWAKKYLSLPLTAKSYRGKILQALWQIIYSLAAIIFYPSWIKSALPEKIVGADLIWDLAKLSSDNNLSVYLLGGFNNTAELATKGLKAKYLGLRVVGTSNKNPGDAAVIEDINKVKPDLLFVAYGPIKQEEWIAENLEKLEIKFAIGLGGTFDYIAGAKSAPPKIIRASGLEWLWRLFTQPRRFKRIINATFGLTLSLLRYKVFMSLPYRPNGAFVILNSKNEVLVTLRNPGDRDLRDTGDTGVVKFKDYWQLPQGGIDGKESLIETAKREMKEELNINNLEFIQISKKTTSYLWKNGRRPLVSNIYHFKGQEQQIIYLRFTGPSDNEIKVDNHELIDYRWAKIDELKNIIHPEKINLTKIVLEDLNEMLKNAII